MIGMINDSHSTYIYTCLNFPCSIPCLAVNIFVWRKFPPRIWSRNYHYIGIKLLFLFISESLFWFTDNCTLVQFLFRPIMTLLLISSYLFPGKLPKNILNSQNNLTTVLFVRWQSSAPIIEGLSFFNEISSSDPQLHDWILTQEIINSGEDEQIMFH